MPHHNRPRLIAITDQGLDPQKKYVAGKNGTLREEKVKKALDAIELQPLRVIQELSSKEESTASPIVKETKEHAEINVSKVVESEIATPIAQVVQPREVVQEILTTSEASTPDATELSTVLETGLKEDKPLEKKKKKPFFTA